MWNVDRKAFLAALATLPGTLGSQSATIESHFRIWTQRVAFEKIFSTSVCSAENFADWEWKGICGGSVSIIIVAAIPPITLLAFDKSHQVLLPRQIFGSSVLSINTYLLGQIASPWLVLEIKNLLWPSWWTCKSNLIWFLLLLRKFYLWSSYFANADNRGLIDCHW